MKMRKNKKFIEKILLIFLLGMFFFTLFLRPQYHQYQNNWIILENKKKILEASHFKISEEEYLDQLNHFELELDLYRKLIPEQEGQQLFYEGIKEVIEKSQVELMELDFSDAFIIEINDFEVILDKDKKNEDSEFFDRQLYGMPIRIKIGGDEISLKKLFNLLEEASPLMRINYFNLEESKDKMCLNLELLGYFFQKEQIKE